MKKLILPVFLLLTIVVTNAQTGIIINGDAMPEENDFTIIRRGMISEENKHNMPVTDPLQFIEFATLEKYANKFIDHLWGSNPIILEMNVFLSAITFLYEMPCLEFALT